MTRNPPHPPQELNGQPLTRNISSMKRSVLSPDETLRRELKIRRTSECFWWTSRCSICWWITLSNALYYFTIKMILERKNEQFLICFLNSHKTFNPFAPEPPKIALGIHVLSTACNVMSFNDQGQSRYYRSCARWRKLSNHTWAQFSEGYQRKRPKKHVTLTWKFPWKSCSTTHLPFY